MRQKVTHFKSLKLALKELEPFVRDSRHLWNGKPLKRFGGLRPRELWGNWLLCAAVNAVTQAERLTFTSDPEGTIGDGIIYDTAKEMACPMEHVLARRTARNKGLDADALILRAVTNKQKKGGTAYASGKTLVVLLEDGGEWFPNKIATQLPTQLDFEAVWVVGLQGVEDGEYVYNVTRLDLSRGNAPVWRVHIVKDFDDWKVEPVQ